MTPQATADSFYSQFKYKLQNISEGQKKKIQNVTAVSVILLTCLPCELFQLDVALYSSSRRTGNYCFIFYPLL